MVLKVLPCPHFLQYVVIIKPGKVDTIVIPKKHPKILNNTLASGKANAKSIEVTVKTEVKIQFNFLE